MKETYVTIQSYVPLSLRVKLKEAAEQYEPKFSISRMARFILQEYLERESKDDS